MELVELSELVDRYYQTREIRLESQRKTDALDREEKGLKAQIIAAMNQTTVTKIGGRKATVTLQRKVKPVANDWLKVYAYIDETAAYDLLQKRLNESAVKARWEDGIIVPGIEKFPVDDLSVSKPGG